MRPAIIDLHEKGFSATAISKRLAAPRSTVNLAILRYKELGTTADRPRKGKPATVSTPSLRKKVRKRLGRNTCRSVRQMAKQLNISRRTLGRIVKSELNLFPYKLTKAHYLNEKNKQARLKKVKVLLKRAAAGQHRTTLFTDEKLFTVQRAHNHQNDRQWLPKGSGKASDRETVSREQHPASVMVWAGICSSGKTPLVFIDQGVKINARLYQEQVLKSVLVPWALTHYGKKHWSLQQDWAPAHKAKTTMALCQRLFPDPWSMDIWPSSSPDLNPMDFSVWSILESKACATRHTTVESLKRTLQEAWDEITVEQVAAIVDHFPKRLKACISAKGGHFEQSL